MIFVRVGSINEDETTAGLSHFLEHLLFDGTQSRSRVEIKEAFDRLGGYTNAYTREEYTAYMIVMPREFIKEGIELQADMLLNSIFPDEELAKERNVVLEEIKKDRDNPYYFSQELFSQQFYRKLPYANPVLGYDNTIRTIPKSRILSYYHRYYTPNNMTAIVIGDFVSSEIVEVFKKFYGAIEPRPHPELKKIRLEKIKGIKKFVEETNTQNTYLRIGFLAPLIKDNDAPAFALLSQILVGGKDSRIYRALMAKEMLNVVQVEGGYENYSMVSSFQILAILRGDKEEDVLQLIQGELERVGREGVTEEELERAKVAFKVKDAFDQESFLYQEMDIAQWLAIADYNFRETYLEKLLNVKREEVRKLAQKYFVGKGKVLALVKPPKEKETAAPSPGTSKIVKKVLANGLTLIAKENFNSKITATHILIGNRMRLEPEEKMGIGNFVSEMLDEGTANRTGDQILQELANIGAKLKVVDDFRIPYDDYYESKDYSYIRLETINDFQEKGLDLLADLVKNANFPPAQVEKVRGIILGLIAQQEDNASKVALNLLFQTFLKDTPYERPIWGTKESILEITQDDLKEYYKKAYSPNNLIISIVGKDKALDLISLLEKRFGDMKPIPLDFPEWKKSEKKGGETVTKKVKKEQAYIYWGILLPGVKSEDVPALMVMNSLLSDRLEKDLREKQGLAYSIGSKVEFTKELGWFYVAMGTRNENISRAKEGIQKEIERLKETVVSEEEINTAINSFWGHHLRFHQSGIGQAYYLGLYEYLGLGYEYDSQLIEVLRKVSPIDVKEVAKKYLRFDKGTLAIAGDI